MNTAPPEIKMPPRPNLPAGHIGYYNAAKFPVTFTSNYANRGPATIDPAEAIRDPEGKLVEYDPDLERMVRDKILRRIVPGDPRYKELLESNAKFARRAGVFSQPANEAPVGPMKEKNKAQTQAPAPGPFDKTNPKPQLVEGQDYTIEEVDGVTYYLYSGRKFSSLTAMQVYVESMGGASGTVLGS